MKLTLKISLAVLAALPLQLSAAPISAADAAAVAQSFLHGGDLTALSVNPARVSSRLAKSLRSANKPFYIFNRDGGGFVIVAGDDMLPQVLGYSTSGCIDADNMPQQLDALLAMNAELISAGVDASASSASGAGTVIVEPLIGDVAWGQSYPFNAKCPANGSSNYYVGCVATAATQIMKLYNYPSHGTGSKQYTWNTQTLSADFGSTAYDWDNMPGTMPDEPTAAQVDAASTLAYHFGVAVEMEYLANGSGAYTMLVPTALKDYFGYDRSLRMHSREYYDTDEWMAMIRAELLAGRPVYYAATSEDRSGGHAFVCDGFDDADYVHINWGWFGSSNGYFLINHLNPSSVGAGGGSGGYNVDQEIITGFAPAGTVADAADIMPVYGATRLSASFYYTDITLMTYAQNLDTRAFEGSVHAVLTDAESNIIADIANQDLSIAGFTNGKSGATMVTVRNIPVKGYTVADGYYRLRLAYQAAGSSHLEVMRHPAGLPSYMNVTIDNGQIVDAETHQPSPEAELLTQLTADGEVYANGSAKFSTTVANLSTDFDMTELTLRFTSVATGDTFDSTHTVSIYNRSTEDVELSVDLDEAMTPGDYYVSLFHTGYESATFDDSKVGRAKVTVLAERTAPVIRFSSGIVDSADDSQYIQGNTIILALGLKNYGAAGSTRVICRIAPVDNPTAQQVLIAGDITVAKGESLTKTIYNALAVDPGDYLITTYYLDGDSREQLVTGAEDLQITVKANDALTLEAVSFDMPTQIKPSERVAMSLTVKANARYSGYIYVRLRQFTNSGGEIVYMGNNTIEAGQTKILTTNYRPSIADGIYMPIVEARYATSTTLPLTNRDAYYREITIGESSAIDHIDADTDIDFTFDGTLIACPSANAISLFDLNGRLIAAATNLLSVENLASGVYIARIETSNGTKTTKIVK